MLSEHVHSMKLESASALSRPHAGGRRAATRIRPPACGCCTVGGWAEPPTAATPGSVPSTAARLAMQEADLGRFVAADNGAVGALEGMAFINVVQQ